MHHKMLQRSLRVLIQVKILSRTYPKKNEKKRIFFHLQKEESSPLKQYKNMDEEESWQSRRDQQSRLHEVVSISPYNIPWE